MNDITDLCEIAAALRCKAERDAILEAIQSLYAHLDQAQSELLAYQQQEAEADAAEVLEEEKVAA